MWPLRKRNTGTWNVQQLTETGLRKGQKKATVSGHAGKKGEGNKRSARFSELDVLGFCQADWWGKKKWKSFQIPLVFCFSKWQQDVIRVQVELVEKNNQVSWMSWIDNLPELYRTANFSNLHFVYNLFVCLYRNEAIELHSPKARNERGLDFMPPLHKCHFHCVQMIQMKTL